MTCIECEQPSIARGMCAKHYQRWKRRHRDEVVDVGYGLPAVDRVLARVAEDANGCWVYTWATDPSGYARVRGRGGKAPAYRVTWEHFIGPWPDGLTFDHLCRNTSCVNPWHGEPVPASVNSSRNNNSIKTHCPQGHPYDSDNTRYASGGRGRVCRICRAEASRAYRARKKESA